MSPPLTHVDVERMALYNLDRARVEMARLSNKPTWESQDTATFDCMHYFGTAALDHAAACIGLTPGDRVVDIGSGFSGTGRYLHQKYGADVTGIELQTSIHEMAETITQRNEMSGSVRSINGDFARVVLSDRVDHIVSFLCILHIPDRAPIFEKAAALLKDDGMLYIEDYYARTPADEKSARLLKDVVSCPFLPTSEKYVDHLKAASFGDIRVEDVTELWAGFVHDRAVAYRAAQGQEPSLQGFFDAVDFLFSNGCVGGLRITAVKVAANGC